MLNLNRLAWLKAGAPPRNVAEAAFRARLAGGVSYEKTVGPAPIISISDAKPKPAKSLIAGMEPIQAGSGDPSPDNIRPITGRTGVTAWRTGKNLWNKDRPDAQYGYYLMDGMFSTNSSYRCLGFICSAGDKFTKSGDGWGGIVTFWNGSTFVSSTNSSTVTIPNGVNIVKFACTYASTNAQLELGSTDSPYEPYVCTSYPVSWQSEAGTVYGGTVDVVSGVLTVTDAEIASYNGETLPSTWISDRDVYAEGTTPTIGAQVVYELAAPQTFHLTPTQIQMLKGANVLWSDADDLSLTYIGTTPANLLGGMLGGGFGGSWTPPADESEEGEQSDESDPEEVIPDGE